MDPYQQTQIPLQNLDPQMMPQQGPYQNQYGNPAPSSVYNDQKFDQQPMNYQQPQQPAYQQPQQPMYQQPQQTYQQPQQTYQQPQQTYQQNNEYNKEDTHFEECATAYSDNESSVTNLGCLYAGGFIALFFFIFGVATYASGSSALNAAIAKNNDIKYSTPDAAVKAMHWCFHIFMVLFGGSLALRGKKSIKLTPLVIILGIIAFAFYIAYIAVSFTRDEYIGASNTMNFNDYESYINQMRNANPIVEISKSGTLKNHSNDKVGNCDIKGFKYESTYSKDVSKFVLLNETKGDDIFQFSFELRGTLEPNSESFINSVLGFIDDNVKERDDTCFRYNYIKWHDAEYDYTIQGFKSAIVVSSSGKLPNAVSKGKRVAQGIFFMGVHYCFIMDSIAPKYQSAVGKTDVYIPLNRYSLPTRSEVQNSQHCSHTHSC